MFGLCMFRADTDRRDLIFSRRRVWRWLCCRRFRYAHCLRHEGNRSDEFLRDYCTPKHSTKRLIPGDWQCCILPERPNKFQAEGKEVAYLVLVLIQFGVRRAVLADLLLALVARAEEIVGFKALQTDPAASCATRGLCSLRFPIDTQEGVVWFWVQAEIIFLKRINCLIFVMVTCRVFLAVRAELLNNTETGFGVKGLINSMTQSSSRNSSDFMELKQIKKKKHKLNLYSQL